MSTMAQALAAAAPWVLHLIVAFWLHTRKLEFDGDDTTIFAAVGTGVGSRVGRIVGGSAPVLGKRKGQR